MRFSGRMQVVQISFGKGKRGSSSRSAPEVLWIIGNLQSMISVVRASGNYAGGYVISNIITFCTVDAARRRMTG
ncbi:unnamed protein product [Urochloa humidicola]